MLVHAEEFVIFIYQLYYKNYVFKQNSFELFIGNIQLSVNLQSIAKKKIRASVKVTGR